MTQGARLRIDGSDDRVLIWVSLPTRSDIESVFCVFDAGAHDSTMAARGVTKRRVYRRTKFRPGVIQNAVDTFCGQLGDGGVASSKSGPLTLSVEDDDEGWDLPTFQEFLGEYPQYPDYTCSWQGTSHSARLYISGSAQEVRVSVTLDTREQVESVLRVFEDAADDSRISVAEQPITVFIGHGRDPQWRDLRDHLQDQHGIDARAYEVGPRAGLGVKDVLQTLLDQSSFAILVLTAEDERADGEMQARQNVVHELGLFQGRLGFARAIALVEEGAAEFSNIVGINQVRFSAGNIRETFGDVLATIRREFGR